MARIQISAETLAVQADHFADLQTGAIVPSIAASNTFARNEDYELPAGLRYSRYGNPTVILAERLCAKLEGGAEARLFSSGLAACASIIGTIKGGEHILAPRIMYHGAQDLIRLTAQNHNAEVSFFDASDPGSLRASLRPNTAIVWIETPINPTWDIIDIADAAHA